MDAMTARREKILAAVIETYIRTGEPVGSKALMNSPDFSVSSATIRNDMAALSEMGYLEQPHTSAGRVPTDLGYRYYIDKLMNITEPDEDDRRSISNSVAAGRGDTQQLLEKAGDVLAKLTNCAVITTMPKGERASVRRAEIVPIGTKTAMIILLTSIGTIKSKACHSSLPITQSTVERFYQICGAHFINRPLEDISTAMLQTLVASLGECALEMSPFFIALADLADDALATDIMLEGQSNLFNHKELSGNLVELMEFLQMGDPLTNLINSFKGDVDVKIGSENSYRQLAYSSVIVTKYDIGGQQSGSLGVIGPTRLNYAKLIPCMKFISGVVGQILGESFEE